MPQEKTADEKRVDMLADAGAYACSLREPLEHAMLRRYTPIDSGVEVVEIDARRYDAVLAQLAELGTILTAVLETMP